MQKKKSFTEVLITSVIMSAVTGGVMFFEAQLIIWGLSLYHVSSGIWPVWLIGWGFEGILCMGVYGGIQGVKNA